MHTLLKQKELKYAQKHKNNCNIGWERGLTEGQPSEAKKHAPSGRRWQQKGTDEYPWGEKRVPEL